MPATAGCWRRIAEGRHASCLLLTSRKAPPELALLDGSAVRTVALGGLGVDAAQVLLAVGRASSFAAPSASPSSRGRI
jgi:hypothetical protein